VDQRSVSCFSVLFLVAERLAEDAFGSLDYGIMGCIDSEFPEHPQNNWRENLHEKDTRH
jgi:hypothetical protein